MAKQKPVIKPKEEKGLTPQQRANLCQGEIQVSLQRHNCTILARPVYRLRDDGTWSLITTVETVANRNK